jgi:aspartyl-tRNA(Asn)/glutamyl-tRNA(Gln) amidotransferase subunit B
VRGAEEAVAYARELHDLVMRIGICDGYMQEGSFRCDANVSVRKVGETKLGTRCELKNLNSFRFMHEAIEYEARRQIELLESGGSVSQETRLYDPDKGETRALRTKEDAQDYRYFPDPDLLPVIVSEELIEAIRRKLPKLKEAQRAEFMAAGATEALAAQLTATVGITNFASAALREAAKDNVPEIANWIVNVISGKLNADNLDFSSSPVPASQLRRLAERVADGTLSGKLAREVLDAMWLGEGDVDTVIERRGLRQISDAGALEKLVDEVLAANARQVADYRSGREKAFNSLVGQVMKATRGKANPAQVNEILRRRLG